MYIKIEKEIPLKKVGKWDRVVEMMSVGDSFLTKEQNDCRTFRKACARKGYSAARRREGNKYRMWKIAGAEV